MHIPHVSGKAYFLIALGVAVVVFVIGLTIGEDIADWAREKQDEAKARGQDTVAAIFEPVEFTFDSDTYYFGAAITGILWPLALLYIVVVLIGLVAIPGADAATDIDREVSYLFYHL